MRNARPHALSEDGRRLIVETDDGEQIAILADARLRQLLRGERPRPQLEIEMDTELTPREIQARVRAGASVEELAAASGMPTARIEAFASPVIAEREHIAGMAQIGSIRRRGEQTGHRTLRAATAERLRERDVDPDSITWDAYKMDDGRWSISADYVLQDTERQAIFFFDHRGRFSVSGNEDARWMIGEQANDPLAESTTEAEDVDTEPTVKLAGDADELALLRAVETGTIEPGLVEISGLDTSAGAEAAAELRPVQDGSESAADDESGEQGDDQPAASVRDQSQEDSPAARQEEAAEIQAVPEADGAEQADGAEPSQLDLLYDILGNDGYSEDSVRVYDGLSDGAAVPDVGDSGWQAPVDEEVPAEPEAESPVDEAPVDEAPVDEAPVDESVNESESDESPAPEPSDEVPEPSDESVEGQPAAQAETTGSGERPDARADLFGAAPADPTPPKSATPSKPEPPAAEAEPTQDALPGADAEKPKPKAKRKRRASVPSWDEIMFGSPKGK